MQRYTLVVRKPIRFQTKTCNRIYKIEFNPLVKRARMYTKHLISQMYRNTVRLYIYIETLGISPPAKHHRECKSGCIANIHI